MLSARPAHQKKVIDPDAGALRRVGWRLAALTVGLLCALLLVLGSGIYVITQHTLLTSLQNRLIDHARRPPAFLLQLIRTDTRAPTAPFFSLDDPNGDRVFFTALDRNLVVLGSIGPSGHALVQPAAAHEALRAGVVCCTQLTYVHQDYLTYSVAVATIDGQVMGVVQTSMSEQQYEASLQTLLQVLLLVSSLGLLASAAISAVLARRALGPIQRALQRQRDFVADAAHELRTPLTIQRMAMELGLAAGTLADAPDERCPSGTSSPLPYVGEAGDGSRDGARLRREEEMAAAIEQSLVENAHLTRLVDALSLLARADSGALTLERRVVDLGHLAEETAGDVEVLAEEHGVGLHVEVCDEATVLGDAGRLRQLILILLDNALKFTPAAGLITVRVERQDSHVKLQVRDTGPGIDQHDLPHLFDRFYRADRARSNPPVRPVDGRPAGQAGEGGGMGLGLSIGRWIAEAHGGAISVASSPGQGALFTVSLPLGR